MLIADAESSLYRDRDIFLFLLCYYRDRDND